jgi:hypothetical protein
MEKYAAGSVQCFNKKRINDTSALNETTGLSLLLKGLLAAGRTK